MTSRAVLIVSGFAVCATAAGSDEPIGDKAKGRVVEGSVVAGGNEPVQGARVLFGQPELGMTFVEAATATTDARGRYRADLTAFPWSSAPMRVMVLAPGFQAVDRPFGAGATTADVELTAQPWKETQLRTEGGDGRPVEGVQITCSVGGVTWARLQSDAEGRCRIAMAPEVWIRLSAEHAGARTVEATFGVTEDGLNTLKLPILPPYRGRVLDPEGRPVPDATVGNGWLTYGSDGEKRMGPFYREPVTTDREGRFAIAPVLRIRDHGTRWGPPEVEPFCFADATFRRVAFRPLDPAQAKDPIEVTLRPSRQVRVPVAPGSVAPAGNSTLSTWIEIVPRPERPDRQFCFLLCDRAWKGWADRTAGGDVIEEYLPEGTYRLKVVLSDDDANASLGEAKRELIVPSGEGPLDLPPMELEPTAHQKLVGRPAPEIEATDLDTGRPVTLADFRGKVVVLDFWGYWCGPCVGNMPHLVELRRKFAGRPLEILALHDQSVRSRAEYDRKIAPARWLFWGGRDVPLRVLLDRPDPKKPDDRDPVGTGSTVERYEIQSFPTLFVIDGNGTVVDKVWFSDHQRLESLVRESLEKVEAH